MRYSILLLLLIILNACNGQSTRTTEPQSSELGTPPLLLTESSEAEKGIIYFSGDNGMTWENRSHGLPEKISIGLGGIAVSATTLGVATKESGIYLFDVQKAT
jgi:hypothetical protein